LQKIAAWFRSKYGGALTKNKKSVVTFRQLFDRKELDPPAPVRARIHNFYSARFYEERIKRRFEAKWAAQMSLHRPGQKLPAKITVQNEAIKESWLAESEAFRNEVLEALNKEHDAKVEVHKTVVEAENLATPESYQMSVELIILLHIPWLMNQ
jgi:hypothetical protein